jgi:hypothetical protein
MPYGEAAGVVEMGGCGAMAIKLASLTTDYTNCISALIKGCAKKSDCAKILKVKRTLSRVYNKNCN